MTATTYNVLKAENGAPIKAWTKGVPLVDAARQQLLNAEQLPFIYKWVAAMPEVHRGIGVTVGSVIPTRRAIIPAAVGVDIGCGMMAVRTFLHANHLPGNLPGIRNYVTCEHHYGENVLITRKGAVPRDREIWASSRAAWARAFVHRAWQGQSGELHEL